VTLAAKQFPAARPILKWVGGKARLLPDLMKRVPSKYGRYFEPFVGGAALFFHLAPARAVLSDLNQDLITVYSVLRDDVEGLIRRVTAHSRKHDALYYYALRDRWNAGQIRSSIDRAAAFLYFNKTCFNGLWRVNRDGLFNVPIGRYSIPAICRPALLRAAHRVLSQAELGCWGYHTVLDRAERGDFVYFDPPYDPLTKTARFTSYTAATFTNDDQRELARISRVLVKRGVHVIVSNSDTPFVRSLYEGFVVARVSCARTINSKVSKRGKINELIISGQGARFKRVLTKLGPLELP